MRINAACRPLGISYSRLIAAFKKSNVELGEELPNMMLSRRFFQANLKTVQIVDEMLGSLLDIKS